MRNQKHQTSCGQELYEHSVPQLIGTSWEKYWLEGSELHYDGRSTCQIQIVRWSISYPNLHESVKSQKISS